MLSRFFMAVTLAAVTFSAFAADIPRKIDFTIVLKDPDDADFQECADQYDKDCKVKRPMTLGSASLRALSMLEANLDVVESQRRGQLAVSVYKSTGAQLTADEIVLIKKQLAKSYSPLVVQRALAILDPAAAER